MKFQMFTLVILVINACLFQSTHQYRLSKRALTEYDLTSFIVNTCSADKGDMFIQNLCDQTSQSALMGNFPSLIDYCATIGIKMIYCYNINRRAAINQNSGTKRSGYRRLLRSLSEDEEVQQKELEIDNEIDLEQKMIIQMCIKPTDNLAIDTNAFCSQALKKVLQGEYPEIERLCKQQPGLDYCRYMRFYSSLLSWPLSKSSSLILPSSTNFIKPSTNPEFTPSSTFKSADTDSFIDQEKINKQNSLSSSSSSLSSSSLS